MNILQIIPNRGWGGGEKYVWELARSLGEAGHQVHTLLPPCDILAGRFAGMHTSTLKFRGPYDLSAIRALARTIRDQHIEIVHTHIFKHAMAALLARRIYGLNVKVVLTRHLCRAAKNGMHYPWLYRHIDRLIFVSTAAQESFLSSRPTIDPAKLCVIHNSVRPDTTVRKDDLRQSLHVGSDRFIIGFAGTITPHKGVGFLIDLAEQLRQSVPEILFIVAGQAGKGQELYLKNLHEQITQRGLEDHIRFIGLIDHTIAFFRQTDAVIVPTLIPESFGLVVLEGMIARVPILFSENILPEVITSEEGVQIDTRDIQESSRIIAAIRHNPALSQRLAEKGHERWQTLFSYPVFLARITGLYRELL